MRVAALLCLLGAIGCAAPEPPPPLPEETLEGCIRTLVDDPRNERARALFPLLVRAADDETMDVMRTFHGTGETMMNHNYPSHRWIHPFLRGCRLAEEGERDIAQAQFTLARIEVVAYLERGISGGGGFPLAILEESRLRLEELDRH